MYEVLNNEKFLLPSAFFLNPTGIHQTSFSVLSYAHK